MLHVCCSGQMELCEALMTNRQRMFHLSQPLLFTQLLDIAISDHVVVVTHISTELLYIVSS